MNAFNTYQASHPDTWLIIIGGVGTLYEDAVAHAKSLAASDHIILIYSMQNPMPVLKNCDLFLLSSFYEGRPIVLMEAAYPWSSTYDLRCQRLPRFYDGISGNACR